MSRRQVSRQASVHNKLHGMRPFAPGLHLQCSGTVGWVVAEHMVRKTERWYAGDMTVARCRSCWSTDKQCTYTHVHT